MPHEFKISDTLSTAAQHRRSADLLAREAAMLMGEADRQYRAAAQEGPTVRSAFAAAVARDWRVAPRVRERNERICAEWGIQPRSPHSFFPDEPLVSRTLTVATGTAAGYLSGVANQLSVAAAHDTAGQVMSMMSVVTSAGNAGGQFVGQLGTLPTVTVLASETTAASEVTPVAGQALMTPKNLATWGRYSRQFALQSESAAAAVSRLHSNGVRSKALQQILEGAGSNGELLGLSNNSDVPSAAGTTLAMSHVVAALESVEKSATGPAFAWVVSASAAKILRARAEVSGGPAIMRDGRIGGYPVFVTGCTTNALAVFGAWVDLQVFQWRPIEIDVDAFSDFQSGILGVRAWLSLDALPQLPNSFYCITGVT
jgi:hypothetical protein